MIRQRAKMGVTAEYRVDANVSDRDERGDTFIEVLLALIVLSLTAVALILAFSTSIAGSADHRRLATANTVLASASQQAIAQIQSNSSLFTCPYPSPPATTTFVANNVSFSQQTTGTNYLAGDNYGSYTPTISNVQYWNGTIFQGTCFADVPVEVTVEVQLGHGSLPITNTFVVNLPSGNLGTASNTSNTVASQLVFATNQTESATGEPGVAFSPQPVVSVLDVNSQLDATDLSPIVLSIESPSGGSISGCSADDPNGQATFSGCVISGPTGIYVVQATVLGQSLNSDPSGSALNENSVNPLGTSFWQQSPNWYTTTFTVSVSGSPDKVVFATGHTPTAGLSGYALSTQPVIDIVYPTTNQVDTSQNGTVTLTLSGGQMVGCTNAAANVVTSSNDEVITATAVRGVVTLTGCTFAGAIFYNATASPAGADPTTYTITASYPGAVSATSTIAVTGPGVAAQLEFVTQPGGVASLLPTAALSPQPQVQIEDGFGNPEYLLTPPVTVNLAFASGGTVPETLHAGTQSLGNKTGIVTFSGVTGSAYGGNLSLTATYSGLSVTSGHFSISPLGGETMQFSTQPVAGLSGASLSTQPVITIYDSKGNVDTGLTTTLSLKASGGLLVDCTGLTPNAGVVDVSTCLFSGTVGQPYTLTASFTDGLSQLISVTSDPISPTGAGTPTRILFITPAGQPVGTVAGALLTTQPSVQIVDSWGNVVTSSSATITLTSSAGGTLSGCVGLTAVVGVVNATGCTFGGTVNTLYTMTASSPGLASATSNPFDVTQGGTPASVTITPAPSSVSASNVTDSQLTIQLLDAWQNLTTSTGTTILSLSSSSHGGFFATTNGHSGTLGASTLVSIPSGIGSISEYYGDENAGIPTITAQNTAPLAAFGSGTLTVNAAPASQIVWSTSPTTSTAGSAVVGPPAVEVEDPYGNPVSGAPVTITVKSGPGPLAGSSTVNGTTSANGVATFSNLVLDTAGSYTITAADGLLNSLASSPFTVNAAAANKIAITTQPATSIIAGGTESLSVSVEDPYGNLVSSTDSISVALSSNSIVAGTTTLNAVGGVANFSGLQITAAGNYTIKATDNANTAWMATTNPFTVIAAAPFKIAITTQPAATMIAGGTESLSVSVEDTYGNVAISADPIALTLSPVGFVAGTTTLNAAGGVANFSGLQITAAGNYTISAKDNNHPTWTATTNPFTVTAATPSKVIWVKQPGTSIAGSDVVGPPTVEVEDTYNNPVNLATVTMAVTSGPPNAAIVRGGTVTTGTDGVATFSSLVLGAAGNYTITASVGSAPSSVPSSSFTVSAGAAKAIMVWGGNGQSATIGANFSSPLSAFVTDASGNPVSGATVTFTAPPSSGASGTFRASTPGGTCLKSGGNPQTSCTATTDAYGIAESFTYTANTTVGVNTPTAGITGATAPFSETNTTPTLAIISAVQSFATTTTDSGTSSGSVIVQAQDGNGNPVVQTTALTVALNYAAVTGTLTLTNPPGSVVIPAGASSASFTLVSGSSTAAETVKITATNGTASATQNETVLVNATSTGFAVTTSNTPANPLTVSPTSGATFPIAITNNNGSRFNPLTRYYEITSTNGGMLTGETWSSPVCTRIAGFGGTGTIEEALSTSASRPAGTYTVDFIVQQYTNSSCTGAAIAMQVDGGLKASAGSATSNAIAGGDGQFATHSTAFTNPFTAVVLDADGNPMNGVLVTFVAPSSSTSGTFAAGCTSNPNSYTCVATTNAEGVATASTFTANATIGSYQVQVTAPLTPPNPLIFHEENT